MMYRNLFSNMMGVEQRYSLMHMQDWGWWMSLILIAIVWSLVWKGLALWKAARRGDNIWFVALLVVNTLGILEILYIFVFTKKFKSVE